MFLNYLFTYSLYSFTIVLIIIHFYRKIDRSCNYWKKRGVKGPKPLPIIGNILDLVYNPFNELQVKNIEKYGNVFGHTILSQAFLTVAEPELIRQIAIKDFNCFNDRLNFFLGDPLLSQTLPLLNGKHWKRARNIVSPAFSSGKIRRMFPLVQKCADNTLQHIRQMAIDGKEVELKKLMTAYTMDVTAKCVFALDINIYENPNGEFLRNAYEFFRFKLWRVLLASIVPRKVQKYLNVQIVPEYLIEYFANILRFVIDERKRSNETFNDFVKLIMDAEYSKKRDIEAIDDDTQSQQIFMKTKLDESEIISQSISFFTGGYETSAALLNFCVYALAMNGEVQDRLHKELSEQFIDENEDYDTMNTLTYLDCVINETLRMYTPVVFFDRQASQNYKLENGIQIEKGTVITLPYYAVHHNPEYFPEPDSFKPERFLPENRNSIKPYTFIPFGVGPRNCVGMRFASLTDKLFIAKIVKKFKIIATENTPSKPKFIGKMFILTSEPIHVKFEPR